MQEPRIRSESRLFYLIPTSVSTFWSKGKCNLMKLASLGLFAILMCTAFTCETTEVIRCFPQCCDQTAIVKDLNGLDGCSIGLELTNDQLLIPERRVYVQAPGPEDDPAYYFEFVPGDTVCIAYNEVELMTSCMAGRDVFLTCIKKISKETLAD
jgi:hypothetical protein